MLRAVLILCILAMTQAFVLASEFDKLLVAIASRPDLNSIVGTGFITSPKELIVTADHVLLKSGGTLHDEIWAISPVNTGRAFKLRVVKRLSGGPNGRDIAVLTTDLPLPLTGRGWVLSNGSPSEAGDTVLIGGFPLVFDKVSPFPLVRSGIVASTTFKSQDTPIIVLDMAAVNGFSGSPVVSIKHGVIGVFTGYPRNRRDTNFSIAAPIKAKDLEELETK